MEINLGIFQILCGLLYIIGAPFGWDYMYTSIIVCVYLWPILCTLSTLPILYYAIRKFIQTKRIVWGVTSCLSLAYTYMYVASTFVCHKLWGLNYEGGYRWAFAEVVDILRRCAVILHTTYEMLNIFIYVILFAFIIGFNLFITSLLKRSFNEYELRNDTTF